MLKLKNKIRNPAFCTVFYNCKKINYFTYFFVSDNKMSNFFFFLQKHSIMDASEGRFNAILSCNSIQHLNQLTAHP